MQAIMDRVESEKTARGLDIKFSFEGNVELACDRCGDKYQHPLKAGNRVIYSFDEKMNFDGYEVIFVGRNEPFIDFVREFIKSRSRSILVSLLRLGLNRSIRRSSEVEL